MTENLKTRIIAFFENGAQFYGKKVAMKEAISTNVLNFDRHFTSFSYLEFDLVSISTRISGGRASFAGEKQYYEIGLDYLVYFEEIGENQFEFIEKYSETVYRKTFLTIK
jgi:hypothetical protein